MKMSNKLYDVLKWIVVIFVPLTITLLETLTMAWHWDIPLEAIVTTISAVAAFIGGCIGVSTITYNREQKNGI